MVIGSICGFIFILIQLILLIDFAHRFVLNNLKQTSFLSICFSSWNENWVEKGEEGSKKHYCGLIFFTATFYIISVVAVILLYVFYASKSSCSLNIFFITINLILCIIVSIISVLPSVQNYHSTSGLLQSSFVTLYVIFLTWSSITSEKPGKSFYLKRSNMSLHVYKTKIFLCVDKICNPSWYGIINKGNSTIEEATGNGSVGVSSIIALIIFFCLIVYSAYGLFFLTGRKRLGFFF